MKRKAKIVLTIVRKMMPVALGNFHCTENHMLDGGTPLRPEHRGTYGEEIIEEVVVVRQRLLRILAVDGVAPARVDDALEVGLRILDDRVRSYSYC